MMPTRSSTSSMVTWNRSHFPTSFHPPPTTCNLPPGPAVQIMPPLLVEGIIWPGMGPPGQGPLRPPRPEVPGSAVPWSPALYQACSLQKFCANREVPIQTQDGRTERLRLNDEVGKTFVPLPKRRCWGCLKTLHACSIAQMALPWL